MGDVPTLDVSHDETFVAPLGVIFCKVLQGIKNNLFGALELLFYVFFRTVAASLESFLQSVVLLEL